MQSVLGAPVIYVIIPAYNAEATIARSLDSLMAQTCPLWHAIVVDDGSADTTPVYVQEYAGRDSRFTLVDGGHHGAAAARNNALAIAAAQRAEYITFLDADDFLEPDALESMLGTARQTGADIVHCKYFSEYASGYSYVPKDLFPRGSVIPAERFASTVYWKMITGIQMNHVCTKLYRGALLEGKAFDASMKTGEDLLLNMHVFPGAKSYAYLARPLYHYLRDTAGGLTNTGVSWRKKLHYNWLISKQMLVCLPSWKADTLWYKFFVVVRPFILLVSKTYRSIRSKIFEKKPEKAEVVV